jgi:hypothetical protein
MDSAVALPDEPPALAHIEKTLADSYRKEIDQEENVWRTLPFFTATLTLQLAALYQLAERMPSPLTYVGATTLVLLSVTVILIFLALRNLISAVTPRDFRYVASEPDLLGYANQLIAYEAMPVEEREEAFNALIALKQELATQYAAAAHNNRQINKDRELKRSEAGKLMLWSMILTVVLVIAVESHYVANKFPPGASDVGSSQSHSPTFGRGSSASGAPSQKAGPAAAADAAGDKGRGGDAGGGVLAGGAEAGKR